MYLGEQKYVSLENRKVRLKKDTSAAISEYAKGKYFHNYSENKMFTNSGTFVFYSRGTNKTV